MPDFQSSLAAAGSRVDALLSLWMSGCDARSHIVTHRQISDWCFGAMMSFEATWLELAVSSDDAGPVIALASHMRSRIDAWEASFVHSGALVGAEEKNETGF